MRHVLYMTLDGTSVMPLGRIDRAHPAVGGFADR